MIKGFADSKWAFLGHILSCTKSAGRACVTFAVPFPCWCQRLPLNLCLCICSQIVAAFGVYIVGDELLNVSGLLGIVALGTWLAAKGRHRISSNVNKPMRVVWCVTRQPPANFVPLGCRSYVGTCASQISLLISCTPQVNDHILQTAELFTLIMPGRSSSTLPTPSSLCWRVSSLLGASGELGCWPLLPGLSSGSVPPVKATHVASTSPHEFLQELGAHLGFADPAERLRLCIPVVGILAGELTCTAPQQATDITLISVPQTTVDWSMTTRCMYRWCVWLLYC